MSRFRPLEAEGHHLYGSLNVPARDFKEGFPGVTKRFEWFAIDYEGKFWIERAGDYRFALTSETHGELGHGVHSIRVSYFQGPRAGVALVLEVAGPGEPLRIFTTDEFRPPHDQNAHP